jgi:hypothetical protein
MREWARVKARWNSQLSQRPIQRHDPTATAGRRCAYQAVDDGFMAIDARLLAGEMSQGSDFCV